MAPKKLSATISEVEAKVRSGLRVNRAEAEVLYDQADLSDLARLANLARQKKVPGRIVTYLVDRNINYTNVCNTSCSFCAFYRPDPQGPDSYVLSKEILGRKIEELLEIGGTRILLQGGHNDELSYDYYLDLIREALSVESMSYALPTKRDITEFFRVCFRPFSKRLEADQNLDKRFAEETVDRYVGKVEGSHLGGKRLTQCAFVVRDEMAIVRARKQA